MSIAVLVLVFTFSPASISVAQIDMPSMAACEKEALALKKTVGGLRTAICVSRESR